MRFHAVLSAFLARLASLFALQRLAAFSAGAVLGSCMIWVSCVGLSKKSAAAGLFSFLVLEFSVFSSCSIAVSADKMGSA